MECLRHNLVTQIAKTPTTTTTTIPTAIIHFVPRAWALKSSPCGMSPKWCHNTMGSWHITNNNAHDIRHKTTRITPTFFIAMSNARAQAPPPETELGCNDDIQIAWFGQI